MIHKFSVGDLVDIVFTGKEYTGGIGHNYVLEYMQRNPFTVTHVKKRTSSDHRIWYCLHGIPFTWLATILAPSTLNKEPDWEV